MKVHSSRSDISSTEIQLNEEPTLLPETGDKSLSGQYNGDLLGATYFSQGSIIRIVEIEAARGGRFLIVEDLNRQKRWSVPAGLIRLILGRRKGQGWKKNAA